MEAGDVAVVVGKALNVAAGHEVRNEHTTSFRRKSAPSIGPHIA